MNLISVINYPLGLGILLGVIGVLVLGLFIAVDVEAVAIGLLLKGTMVPGVLKTGVWTFCNKNEQIRLDPN